MIKPTPNPPETDPVSPYQFPDSRTLNEAAERALDHYLTPQQRIMGSHTKHDPMFLANPAYNSESLLANASESLDSASEMLSNFAAILEPAHRKTALGIAQVVMLGLEYWRSGRGSTSRKTLERLELALRNEVHQQAQALE